MLLLFALITGSSSSWAVTTTIYSWNGNGSTTTANETGGKAEAKGGNSNIVVGVSQKGNWCLKMGKGFSNTNYIEITLDDKLTTGDKVTIGAFRTSSSAAALGVDFGTTATQVLKDDTSVLESNGTPTDFEITVPAAANGGNKIRLYRNSGSTGMWVSKVVVTTENAGSGTNATWTLDPVVASVLAGQSTNLQLTTNYDGTLNFTSEDPSIATVSYNSSTKVVTVTGVAAGTTTISATGDATATYNAINKAIAVTVKHTELESNAVDVMGPFGYSYFGLTPEGSNAYAQPDVTSTEKTDAYGVGISWARAGSSNTMPRFDADYARFYKGNILTITAPTGCAISKIVFTEPSSGKDWKGDMDASTGDYINAEKTWYATSADVTSLVLTEKTGTNRIGGIKVYLMATSMSFTIPASGYMTIGSICDLDYLKAIPAYELEAYVVTAVSGSTLTLEEIPHIPAGEGVILKGTPGTTYTIPVFEHGYTVSTNLLKVSDGTVKGGDGIYALAEMNSVVGFYKVAETVTIPAGKCYLNTAAPAPDYLAFYFNGGTTGVNDVRSKMADVRGEVYDLQGRNVAQPSKGLYIVNGKKIIIK